MPKPSPNRRVDSLGNIEHSEINEAIEDLGSTVSYAGGRGDDALDLVKRMASEYMALRDQHRGAVSACEDAARLLDELTIYWEIELLPPGVQDAFDAVRSSLAELGHEDHEGIFTPAPPQQVRV